MANAPGGKSVGRVTIRVIPDTSKFRDDLRKSLARIEATESMAITVDKVNLDMAKVREDIKRQFAALDKVEVDAVATAIIDKVTVKRAEVRQSLQDQFDSMGLNVKVGVDLTKAKHDVDSLVNHINRQQGTINVNAATAAATAQMRWLSRDRFISVIPEIPASAMARIEAQLLALSGINVASSWTKDILDGLQDIDKKLPTIGALTSGITSLVSVLLASVSGILALGAGLAAIVPLLLVLPGLIVGTGFAITTLIVALRTGKQELAALAPGMHELADIIQNTYWDAAREPITNLINNLMPQMRTAFAEVSGALGRFTGAFANAFEKQLAGGKLEALFAGISKSFDILSTGTDAFAGALVSLSAVAAKYVPRLAQWFVDLSIRFDNWLAGVANDGRLDAWMERGIKAVSDLGRAIGGIAEQFYFLWKAAEAGGSGGLSGFADTMERWADIMGSPKFQSTVTAIFRGVNDAMTALGEAFVAIGNMMSYLQAELEAFLGSAGRIVGDFFSALAGAMSTPEFANGFTDFFNGLEAGFKKFDEYLPTIVSGIGSLGTLAGELAKQLGPVLGETLAALAKILEPLAKFITESVLPWLGPVVAGVIQFLGDVLSNFFNYILPAFQSWWAEYIEKPFQAFWETYGPGITQAWQYISDKITEFAQTVWPWVEQAFKWLNDFLRDFVQPTLEKFGAWFADPKNKDTIDAIATVVMVLVGALMAIPLAIGVVIAGLVMLIAWIVDTWINISNFINDVEAGFDEMRRNVNNSFYTMVNGIIDQINNLIRAWNSLPLDDISLIAKIKLDPGVQADRSTLNRVPGLYQGGTVVSRGTVLVGEKGPELLNLDKGASVIPLDKTSGTGQTINYYAAPNASLDSEQQLFTAMRRAKVLGW